MPLLTTDVVDSSGQAVSSSVGHGQIEPASGLCPKDMLIELKASPDPGYRVKKWRGTDYDTSTDPNNYVTMTRDRGVTVEFELSPVHHLCPLVIGGSGSVRPACDYYEEGVVTLTARPADGFRVKRWIGTDDDSSWEQTNTITLVRDTVVMVEFERPHVIEVSGDSNAIQQAIDTARDGDTLVVAAGTYQGGINLRGKAITLTNTNPDDPNMVARTVIDCQQSGRGFIFTGGEDANTLVEGFTVTNGSVTGENGGGILVDVNSRPTIRNLVISNCSASAAPGLGTGGLGGGIYVDANTSPNFVNVTVTACTADSN
ncbi:MAG: InlB B-repeat-containing protein, partial [Planctomycetota bacterium]